MSASFTSVVFSFVAQDKVGIVELLAAVIKQHGGNWHESRLMQLNGLFSGIVSLSIPSTKLDALRDGLTALKAQGISVTQLQASSDLPQATAIHGTIELIGPDRTGIVHEISLAMLEHGINIEQMETTVQSAPMSGEALFQATLTFSTNADINEKLRDDIDEIAEQLTLDITINEHP